MNSASRNPAEILKYLLEIETKKEEQQRKLSNAYQIEKKTQEEINDLLLKRFEISREEAQKEVQSSKHNDNPFPTISLVTNSLPPLPRSKYQIDMNSLMEISVKKLEFKRNEGTYFKGNIIAKPWKSSDSSDSVNTLLRDKDGDVARGVFYNIANTEYHSKYDKLFHEGREIIISHPLYEKVADGLVSIRVENTYEFYFPDEVQSEGFAELFEKSKKFKDEANKAIKTSLSGALKKYVEATDLLLKSQPQLVYDRDEFLLQWKILPHQNEQKQTMEHLAVLFSNISHVYFEQNKLLMSLYYAKFSMWCNQDFIKARLRHAKTLAHLLHVDEAQRELDEILKTKDVSAFEKEIQDLATFIRNQTEKYSTATSIAKFMSSQFDFSNGKTYIGPIEVVDAKEKGRGYRARRDIVRGEILLLEKGFVIEEGNPAFSYKLLSELDKKVEEKPLYMNLFPNNICSLPAADKGNVALYKSIKEKKTLFELYRSQRHKEWSNFTSTEIYQLILKTQFNSFHVQTKTGIFANFCLLNHSCDPNVSVWFVDNTAMLLAQRDILKGEEVFITYAPLICLKFERKEKLIHYGFECNCNRCQEVGEWKQKEAQFVGIRCPKCSTEIAINESKTFVCPKGCWQCDLSYYQRLSTQLKEEAIDVEGTPEFKEKSLRKTLDSINKQFPSYCALRAIVFHELGRNYAKVNDQEKFRECFDEIVKIAYFYPFTELRRVFNNLLTDIVEKFQRAPTQKELDCFTYFGMPSEAMKLLWEQYVKSGFKGWFIRF